MLINHFNKKNLFFKTKPKNRKWTRKSLDGKTKSKIDILLSNNGTNYTNDINSEYRRLYPILDLKFERNKHIQ